VGVRADELDLPVPLDRTSYRRALQRLQDRHVVDEHGRLSPYGAPSRRCRSSGAWAELIVNAEDELLPFLAVMSSVESLHRMTREERDLDGVVVHGSDNLTAYNLYAEAYREAGYIGEVYGLSRHLFDEERAARWAERRGVLMKSVEDAALAMASVYRSVGLALAESMPWASDRVYRRFQELLARFMPFDLVIDEETAWGEHARVSKTSVCGSWGAIAGTLRYFADRFGVPRASIEGTQIRPDLLRRYAQLGEPELTYDARRRTLVLTRRAEYYGFELEREVEGLDVFPPSWPIARGARWPRRSRAARRAHTAVRRNDAAIRRCARRGAARRAHAAPGALGAGRPLRGPARRRHVDRGVPPAAPAARSRRARRPRGARRIPRASRPGERAWARGGPDVRRGGGCGRRAAGRGAAPHAREARAHARRRGGADARPAGALHGHARAARAVRATTLVELQELLDLPWAPEEMEESARDGERGSGRQHARQERDERTAANALRRHGRGGRGPGARGPGARDGGGRGRGGARVRAWGAGTAAGTAARRVGPARRAGGRSRGRRRG
jgi:hypothetical protein